MSTTMYQTDTKGDLQHKKAYDSQNPKSLFSPLQTFYTWISSELLFPRSWSSFYNLQLSMGFESSVQSFLDPLLNAP